MPGHLLLPILDLRLPAKLQSCFCFAAEEILREESDLEMSPYAVRLEAPFFKEVIVD